MAIAPQATLKFSARKVPAAKRVLSRGRPSGKSLCNMKSTMARRLLSVLFVVPWTALAAPAPELVVTPQNPNATYQVGEKIEWRVTLRGGESASLRDGAFVLKKGGAATVGQGKLEFTGGTATVSAALPEPGTILAEISAKTAGGPEFKALGGAAVAPEQIKVSAPCPEDFDAFWKAKIEELAKVPANPVLTSGASGKENVDYWKITMDNIRGTKIRGQLARPARGEKLPAMLIVQWAGVYGLPKGNVTGPAAEGWLVLNLNAHDLPIDEPESFYQEQAAGPLKNYTAIGNDDREKSYFLRMFLSCHRAVEYLAGRPDWDGRTLMVTGTSQGGLQTFVTAGLNPKVTAMCALVPAGCDNTATLGSRKPGWPYWMSSVGGRDPAKALETSKYFDAVNFAARVKCPALIGLGLIDVTSPPSGVFAACNQLRGPKEIVVLPGSDHKGKNNTQAPYRVREQAWRKALVVGNPPPLPAK